MKIGLVGGSYRERSLPFDAQRSINLYPVFDEQGKEVSALYGTPGLLGFAEGGTGPGRQSFSSSNGRAFYVSGNKFFEVDSSGNETEMGVLESSTGNVTMDENGFQLGVCDGSSVYIFTYETAAEHVTGGAFNSTLDWTKGSGWTVSAGVATAAGAISTAISQTSSTTLTEGRTYEVIFTITVSAGALTASVGGGNGTTVSVAGTYTQRIVAGSTQDIAFTGVGFTGTLDNVSIIPLAFEKVSRLSLPSGTITFIDGYFVINENDTGKFYISGLYNGFTWDPLDFASAEADPDNLLRPIRAQGQLWLLGSRTGEIWTNTGSSGFPFEKYSGGDLEVGILAPHTAISMDGSLLFVGRENTGSGIVYMAQGFSPTRISTHAIEQAIARATDSENMVAFAYQQDGHKFYFLTGGGLETSLVFDLSTGLWHERSYLAEDGTLEVHLASCGMFAFGKILVGSRVDGNLYDMSQDYFDDDGREILSRRVFTHISNEGERFRMNSLQIDFESGVGTQTGQGQNPVAVLRLSKDGAKTWSEIGSAPIGAVGQYNKRVEWRRLGVADRATFEVSITDPVKRVMTGAYLR